MRRIISILVLLFFLVPFTPSLAQEENNNNYDPNLTLLTLNMAIISVNKILSTQDKISFSNGNTIILLTG